MRAITREDTKYLQWNAAGIGLLATANVLCEGAGTNSRAIVQMAASANRWTLVYRPAGMGMAPVSVTGMVGSVDAAKAACIEALPAFIDQIAPLLPSKIRGVAVGGGMIPA